MKKLLFATLCSLFFSTYVFSQTTVSLGLKGGVNLTFFNVDEANFGLNQDTETGFYTGVFIDFEIKDGFSIQPEVLYIGLKDFEFINTPIYVKYEVANNLDVLVGPSINYFFDFFSNKLKIRADLSTAFNITTNLDVHLKYTLGFQEITPNGLFVGLGYRF
jgi:hypothetical protein